MSIRRETIQGFRDYRGVSLEDIVEDIKECFGSAKFGQKLIFSKLRFEIRKPS